MTADWIEHRRGMDGERLGWMRPSGESFDVIDLLGRVIATELDWLEAESLLDERGIGYLAQPYELLLDGRWVRVRIVEVSSERILVKTEDWGAVGVPYELHEVAFPLPKTLRVRA